MFSKKKKKKESKFFYNPMKVTGALKELGEEYDKREAWLYYGVMLLLAVILSLFFELPWYFIVIVVATYVLCVPKMMINQKRQAYELRRFNDVNAYMSQMAQSFTDTENVITSLNQTAESFSQGRMHDTLSEALNIIEYGSSDIISAEQRALKFIAEGYDCEKIRNLHQYFLNAEELGGECGREFAILEDVRSIWEEAVSNYHAKLKWDKAMGTIMYFCTLIVCVMTMYILPEELSIINILLTQVANTILVVVFVFYYMLLDNRLNTSLLIDGEDMSREKADSYFAYLQGYDAKKERGKYLIYSIIFCGIGIAFMIIKSSAVSLAVAIILAVVGFNLHMIVFQITRNTLKNEISRAFPKWLFDIMLLIQRESVEGAIMLSVEKAPPVLQAELSRVSNTLKAKPHWADAYVSFMADFNVLGVEPAMRKLYTLAIGTGGVKEDVMNEIIKSNMKLLVKAEQDMIERKGDFSEVFQTLPVIIVSFGMMVYCVVMIYVVIRYVLGMF